MAQREQMTDLRKRTFLNLLRSGVGFSDAALRASKLNSTKLAASITFTRAAERDTEYAVAIARAVALGRRGA